MMLGLTILIKNPDGTVTKIEASDEASISVLRSLPDVEMINGQ